jgi:two-component system sensor histidine kinase YesM
MELRDRCYTETLAIAADDIAAACDDAARKAVGLNALLGDLATNYCCSGNASKKFEYYQQLTETYKNSVYSSETIRNIYSFYLAFPDGTEIGWGAQHTLWQGDFYLLPRNPLAVDLPVGATDGATFWICKNNAGFYNVLFFVLQVPVEDSTYLIVVGIRPDSVFSSSSYRNMALYLPDKTLLGFSGSMPFTDVEPAVLLTQAEKARPGKTGTLRHDGSVYITYSEVTNRLGTLLLAEPVHESYPLLRSMALLYLAVGCLLLALFGTLNWRMSSSITAPLSRLSRALEQNKGCLSHPIELPRSSLRLQRWVERYSIRSKLTFLYIAGSIVPALLFLVFCVILTHCIIAKTLMTNIEKTISNVSQELSESLKTIQEVGKSIIYLNDTQTLMIYPDASERDQHCAGLTEYLLYLQPDVSHTNMLIVNVYDVEGTLLYSSHDIFSFSEGLKSRIEDFMNDETVSRQWFYETVGNTNIYSYYRKAYKKSVIDGTGDIPIDPEGFPQIGYLQVGMLESELRSSYALLSATEGVECMILDRDGRVLSAVDSHLIGVPVLRINPDYGQQRAGTLFHYDISRSINASDGWSLYVQVNDWTLQEATLRILFYNSYTLLAALGFVWISAWFILNRIKHPLNQLVLLTSRQTSTQLPSPYVYTGDTDEVSTLVDSFNRMMERLQEQINIRQAVERKRQETELIALQSQINPHFLYNVFTSISFTMLRGRTEDAANMLDMVGRLFRTGIYRGHPIVAMEEELRHVMTYLDIQLIRYNHKLTVHYDLEPDIYHYYILKLTLQPLVENSIYHGIEIKEGPGTIIISGRVVSDRLQFTVCDDGVGIDESELFEIREGLSQRNLSRGIGLNNVNERIKLYFGNQYGLDIESVHPGGTTVTMTMPLVSDPLWEK